MPKTSDTARNLEWIGVGVLTALTMTIQSAIPMWIGVPLDMTLLWGLVILILRYKRTGHAQIGVALMIASEIVLAAELVAGPSGWWHNTTSAMAQVDSSLLGWNLCHWALYLAAWHFLIKAGKRPAPAVAPVPQVVMHHHVYHGAPAGTALDPAYSDAEEFPVVPGTVERPSLGRRTRDAIAAGGRNTPQWAQAEPDRITRRDST